MSDPPFLPYGRQTIEDDDIEAVVEVLRGDYLTTGPAVGRFEVALAARVGAAGAVAVSSGTAALHAACFAAGIGEGDEVLVPAVTFLATANCARYVGAEPVFVDVDPQTGLLDTARISERRTERTRAVIPVHLTGRPLDPATLGAPTEGLTVIEDAAHALGAETPTERVGSCRSSAMAIFSFHPVKHVTTGEGGAITARDPELLDRLRTFRNHGMVREPARLTRPSPGPWYYEQQVLGHNLRLSDIQAALGASQLAKLDRFLSRRRALAARYDRLLASVAGVTPVVPASHCARSAYHLYAVLVDFQGARAEVMQRLRERGIGTQVHYIPLPMQPYYRERGWSVDDFPGALRYYERTLSLPLYAAMTESDVDRVVDELGAVLAELGLG